MKLTATLILVLLISLSAGTAQNQIQIIGSDNTTTSYSIDKISNIEFNINDSSYIIINRNDGSEIRENLNSNSEITFTETQLILTTDSGSIEWLQSEIKSIEFGENASTKYPFGEVEVDEVLVDNLNNPWSLTFLDKDNIIFNEKNGDIFIHNIPSSTTTPVTGMDAATETGQGGLLDITLHPDFANNKQVYFGYTASGQGGYTTAIGKATLSGFTLQDFEEIFRGDPLLEGGQHFGTRIVFDNEGKLYFTIGDRGRMENGQDSTNHYASVIRINDDGSVPQDNPYLDATDAKPEIYTMGNRNIQGMFYVSEKDEIWAIEHGPRGGDELNLIEAGNNYGWPLATYGIDYDGTPISDKTTIPGYADPITYWVPSIAPCGMDMVNYDSNNNELDIIIATLAGSHLHRIKLKDNKVVETVRSLEGYARFRDVQLSPDGYLYAATQSPGRIIRLKAK